MDTKDMSAEVLRKSIEAQKKLTPVKSRTR